MLVKTDCYRTISSTQCWKEMCVFFFFFIIILNKASVSLHFKLFSVRKSLYGTLEKTDYCQITMIPLASIITLAKFPTTKASVDLTTKQDHHLYLSPEIIKGFLENF